MAQPAVPVNKDRTDLLGISPFLARLSVNPPFIWETWVGQFFLAISLKDNISPREVLDAPAALVDEPYPKLRDPMRMKQTPLVGHFAMQQRKEESTSITTKGDGKALVSFIIGIITRQRRVLTIDSFSHWVMRDRRDSWIPILIWT